MSRVGLFTDEPVVIEGLRSILSAHDDLELIPLVCSPGNLDGLIRNAMPDVVLLGESQGISYPLLTRLRRSCPAVHLVLWTRDMSLQIAHQAMEIGVRGIAYKNISTDLLVRCLRTVAHGELWFDRRITKDLHDAAKVDLSRRETQLLTLVSQGLSNKEIADLLMLSDGTVKYYFSRLFKKLNVSDRFELALFGMRCLMGDGRGETGRKLILSEVPMSIIVEDRASKGI